MNKAKERARAAAEAARAETKVIPATSLQVGDTIWQPRCKVQHVGYIVSEKGVAVRVRTENGWSGVYKVGSVVAIKEGGWSRILRSTPPTEPPIGTWVKDRHGAAHLHLVDVDGTVGWAAGPGFYAGGKWEAMWNARGPLEECGPYGL